MKQLLSSRNARLMCQPRQSICMVLVLCLVTAGMTVAVPAGASQPVIAQARQTDWYINDIPEYGGAWFGGHPVSTDLCPTAERGCGYGPSRYEGDSNYAYASATDGRNPRGSWATWRMGTRVGDQEIRVHVPHRHASAQVRYHVTIEYPNGTTNRRLSPVVEQNDIYGWHSLGRYPTNGDVTIDVRYDESRIASGETEAWARSVGIDAIEMRCVNDCAGSTPTTSVPSAPVRLQLSLIDDDSFRIRWDPPADDNGAPITGYAMTVSRSAVSSSVGPWSRTYSYGPNTTSQTFNAAYNDITYRVEIAAQNSIGEGPAISSNVSTGPARPPNAPTDLWVRGCAPSVATCGQLISNKVLASWNPPPGERTSNLQYEIHVSRDSFERYGPWSHTWLRSRPYFSFRGKSGATYTFRVTAMRDEKRSDPVYYEDVVVLSQPQVRLGHEETTAFLDDPDAFVTWTPVKSARAYQMDWRYMEIDDARLRYIYDQILDDDVDENTKDQLAAEASVILEGTEISATQIGGDSAPALDPSSPEVWFGIDDRRYSANTIRGSSSGDWNPANLDFRIHSRNDDYVLQVRVRAIGASQSFGPWSDWAFHPSARFSAGCRALDFYGDIQDILAIIDIAGWVITAAGIATAVFTAGGSTITAQLLKEMAKQIAKEIIKKEVLKRALKSIIRAVLTDLTQSTAQRFLGFVFGCATHGLGLAEDDVRALGWEIVDEAWNDIREENWSKRAVESLFGF